MIESNPPVRDLELKVEETVRRGWNKFDRAVTRLKEPSERPSMSKKRSTSQSGASEEQLSRKSDRNPRKRKKKHLTKLGHSRDLRMSRLVEKREKIDETRVRKERRQETRGNFILLLFALEPSVRKVEWSKTFLQQQNTRTYRNKKRD